jgi:hypothetical protein
VELVLPGAYYLVRMLDGRIDTQGNVAELRAQGVLDEIAQSEAVKVYEQEQKAAAAIPSAEEVAAGATEDASPTGETKKPRKLVKDEERQEGGVKWNIYNTYLKASWVIYCRANWHILKAPCSSYWTWIILGLFIIISQVGSPYQIQRRSVDIFPSSF